MGVTLSADTNMAEAFKDKTTYDEYFDWMGSVTLSADEHASHMLGSNSSSFNQPIGNWNVSSVSRFAGIKHAYVDAFNQEIGDWNTSSATHMDYNSETIRGMTRKFLR